MLKINYAERIMLMQFENPELCAKDGKLTLQELMLKTQKELAFMLQDMYKIVWQSKHDDVMNAIKEVISD